MQGKQKRIDICVDAEKSEGRKKEKKGGKEEKKKEEEKRTDQEGAIHKADPAHF